MSGTPDGALDLTEGAAEPDYELSWPPSFWDLELRRPLVTAAGEKVTHLNLREPTGHEYESIMLAAEGLRRRTSVSLVACLPMAEVARIGLGDVVRAEAYLTAFYDVGQHIAGWEELADGWPAPEWDMPLRAPLVEGDQAPLERLALREPTMDEFEQINRWPVESRRRRAVHMISGVSMDQLARVGIGDLVRAEAYLTSFFGVGQGIGIAFAQT